MIQILQEEHSQKKEDKQSFFEETLFDGNDFQNKYSQYLMSGIKDQLAFYYDEADYNMFLKFFNFFEGADQFDYQQFLAVYNKFIEFVLNNHNDIPKFVESENDFLQFLYDTNILCFIEDFENEPFFRWCYRERTPSNISPKVSPDAKYRIHYGLQKALNVGRQTKKENFDLWVNND